MPGYVGVITAAHVVRGQQVAWCEFWRDGHQSAKLPAQVYAADPTIDVALLVVPEQAFGGRLPETIPLGCSEDSPKPGDVIQSVGCAGGAWATGFRGRVTRQDGGGFWFVPVPSQGRSGSVITDATGGRVVGVLQFQNGDKSEGGAVSIGTILSRMRPICREAKAMWRPCAIIQEVQQCPPGGTCPQRQAGGPFGGQYIVPHLFGDRQRGQSPGGSGSMGGSPWPTLPAPSSPPVPTPAPRIDIDVGSIAEAIRDIRGGQIPAPPDPRIDQALQGAAQAHQRIDGLAKDVQAVGEAVKPIAKIKERLEADAEEGGIKGRIARRVLDRFGEDGEGKGDSNVRLILWVVGGLAVAVGLVHWLRTGHGLVAEALLKASARNPENERLAEIANRLAEREEAARARLPGGKVVAAVETGGDVMAQMRDYIEARLAPGLPNTPPPGAVATSPIPPAASVTPTAAV
jgi:hypothetical protein